MCPRWWAGTSSCVSNDDSWSSSLSWCSNRLTVRTHQWTFSSSSSRWRCWNAGRMPPLGSFLYERKLSKHRASTEQALSKPVSSTPPVSAPCSGLGLESLLWLPRRTDRTPVNWSKTFLLQVVSVCDLYHWSRNQTRLHCNYFRLQLWPGLRAWHSHCIQKLKAAMVTCKIKSADVPVWCGWWPPGPSPSWGIWQWQEGRPFFFEAMARSGFPTPQWMPYTHGQP